MTQVKTRIYNCGGTGLNIGSQYSPNSDAVCFIDSSAANKSHSTLPTERLYIIPDTDGAGGDMAYMMPFVKKNMAAIVDKFPPGKVNIIVTSGGGGTGPAVATGLVDYLLGEGATVFILVVGGVDTTKRLRNTTNLIKNLDALTMKHGEHPILDYVDNQGGEKVADEEILFRLAALDALTDQMNDRIDTKDIENFVHFHRITSVPSQLCMLHIHETRAAAAAVLEPIAVAALVTDIVHDVPYGAAFVRSVGICDEDKIPGNQLHFVINSVGIGSVMDNLEELRVKLTTVQSTFRQRRPTFVKEDLGDGELFLG